MAAAATGGDSDHCGPPHRLPFPRHHQRNPHPGMPDPRGIEDQKSRKSIGDPRTRVD
ncbi:hypothetical protein BO71DRAFT_86903 [Aspergillus ellipticus CBS 707.79]|uniref:Uncharacterized protein n=1 Tax=Aspergillus ellipticus CBS 707.79 TaxID=1448320 RepID=A0A319DR73_9EURO|nr:hypothetical protein BO71DRAFT_86903 [Aspergillus ellipticus CBS 707.79]